ncbi:hypothetical protein LIPSTDRAFT_70401, partial [Lipomyces starkeyi NRRL Y-11557]
MPRSSRTLQITALLPSSLAPADMISALHIHQNCLTPQALTTGYKVAPTTCPAVLSDLYFSPTDTAPIKSYEITEGDSPSGLTTRADGPAGVLVVSAEWHVRPGVAYGEVEGEVDRDMQWTLVEDVTVQCACWLISFVKNNMEHVHRDICRKLVEDVEEGTMAGAAREVS